MKKLHSVPDKVHVDEVPDNDETCEELELDVVQHDTCQNQQSFHQSSQVSVIQANQNMQLAL